MLQHQHRLDGLFHALADPTRRAMVERLAAGPTSVSELGAPFPMSLSAIGQHVQLLESAGLVRTAKEGRVRRVELVPEALSTAESWLRDHRARWERRLDRLGDLLAEEGDDPSAEARPAGGAGAAAGARAALTPTARTPSRARTGRAPPPSPPLQRPARPETIRRRR